jgi:hypothetical protein
MRLRRIAIVGVLALAGASVFGTVAALGGFSSPTSGVLFAVLTGGEEVGENGEANAGDPDGVGSASVVAVGNNRICFSIIVDGIAAPAAAHIHRGGAGVAGPVAVALTQPTGSPGASSGCVRAPRNVVAGLRSNPGNWYVNVHTADFPGGAVRGQLF